MKNIINYSLIVIVLVVCSSFATYQKMDTQLLPTKLRITVIDGLGNFTEGAKVQIFENKNDYQKSTNAVATGLTDKKGRVTFKGLKNIGYYIYAYKGDMNNNGEGVLTGKLQEGRINKVNTVIE